MPTPAEIRAQLDKNARAARPQIDGYPSSLAAVDDLTTKKPNSRLDKLVRSCTLGYLGIVWHTTEVAKPLSTYPTSEVKEIYYRHQPTIVRLHPRS